ncbi:fibrinogen gamma chain-like [Pomacea canaliculata]|uniref:fibrinogen gamma chain-like n=1 Tax=Pomacea canaliculata TaxID=400727 RepID=UPI000D738C4B|nr:fibrinogen gamma chain-like [Pomacea canaliculata]
MLRSFLFLLCVSPCLLTKDTGRCQGEDCKINTWQKTSCTTDDDCDQPHVVCYKHQCRCEPGYFITTNDTCTSTCSTDELQENFTEYPDSGIRGNHLDSSDRVSLEYCKGRCQVDKRCLTFDFKAHGGLCRLHAVTARESPSNWSPKTSKGWTHFQKSCQSTFASHNNWYNLLCHSKMDCPDPNSDCLSGRCLCDLSFNFNENKKECHAPRTCQDWQDKGGKSGVYTIQLPLNKGPQTVWCDMESPRGSWLVFHRRRDFSVDFHRNWTEYEKGFGSISEDFWLGLSTLHTLTHHGRSWRLRVDIESYAGKVFWAEYNFFYVYGPESNYQLYLGTYSGDAADRMKPSDRWRFSTYDRNENDCKISRMGGWWYPDDCGSTNLNSPDKNLITWGGTRLTFSEMKMKPK